MIPSIRPTSTTATKPPVKLALTVVPYLLLAVFLNTSIPKFIGTDADVAAYADIGLGQWLRYVTATFELLGGIGLVVPRTVGLAATGLTALLVGAVLTQAFLVTDGSIIMPAVLMLICGAIAWLRRDQVLGLIARH
jgi:putative oxidoreductase